MLTRIDRMRSALSSVGLEQFNDALVAFFGSLIQRCGAITSLRVNVGTVGNKQFHSGLVTIKDSVLQWCPVEHVLGIYVGTLGNEQLDHGGVACTGCQLKRRVARLIPFIDVGAPRRSAALLGLCCRSVQHHESTPQPQRTQRTELSISKTRPRSYACSCYLLLFHPSLHDGASSRG